MAQSDVLRSHRIIQKDDVSRPMTYHNHVILYRYLIFKRLDKITSTTYRTTSLTKLVHVVSKNGILSGSPQSKRLRWPRASASHKSEQLYSCCQSPYPDQEHTVAKTVNDPKMAWCRSKNSRRINDASSTRLVGIVPIPTDAEKAVPFRIPRGSLSSSGNGWLVIYQNVTGRSNLVCSEVQGVIVHVDWRISSLGMSVSHHHRSQKKAYLPTVATIYDSGNKSDVGTIN